MTQYKSKSNNDFNDFIDENLIFYTFLSFLKTRKKLRKYFSTPIEIQKSESPDFIIKNKTESTGIEVCSGSPQNMHYVSAICKEFPKNSIIELDPILFNKKNLTRDEVKNFIKVPNEKLSGYGWSGYSIEHSWSRNICNIIEQKTEKLNNCFTIHNKNILLINGDFLIIREKDIANDYLSKEIEKSNLKDNYDIVFDVIYIISKVRNALLHKIST